MFGTLVLTLPSEYTGGELTVAHAGAAQTLDLSPGLSGMTWAAFYADCTHTLAPLRDGVRVALVFNLVRAGAPTAPIHTESVVARLAEQLQTWSDFDPVKIAYILEYAYSEAELGWDRLKGVDHGRAHALREAAGRASIDVHLAQLAIDIAWSAEELQ